MGESARFTKGLYAWIGFRSLRRPLSGASALAGKTRWRPRELLRFGIDGLASFTTIPLKVWSYVGLLISLFAFCYAMVFLIKTLIYGTDVPGFPTLVISVMFFAGVQLLSLGIIGEYLGRVYEEVKGRPLFLVAEELGMEDGARGDADAAADARLERAGRSQARRDGTHWHAWSFFAPMTTH